MIDQEHPPETASDRPVMERIAAHTAVLGEDMTIRRALPTHQRRFVGAWCFLDHFGPVDASRGRGLRVGPHPHIGLQTVSWLLQGEILHRDSLGNQQLIRPGQINLMTAGRGICHSEESPPDRPAQLHGLQLWIALPESARRMEPSFEHHAELPLVTSQGLRITLLAGAAFGERSPAGVHSPLMAADLMAATACDASLPLSPGFEYALLVAEGAARIDDEALQPGSLLYLGHGRSGCRIRTQASARLLLLGGEPLREAPLMWWNFVARSKEELSRACCDWNSGQAYFGAVHGYDGARLTAPLPPWDSGPG